MSITQVHAATVTGGQDRIVVVPPLSISQAAIVHDALVNAAGAGITVVPVPV